MQDKNSSYESKSEIINRIFTETLTAGRKSHRDNEFSRILNDGCPVVWE